MPDLLIELFSEEIPARMQARAAADLQKLMTDRLVEAGLTYASAGAFATPRRLALSVDGLTARSPDTREERKGPKVGAPDAAIDGFCRGAGVERAALEIRDTGKGEGYFAVIAHKGRPAAEIVAEALEDVIRTFPWPKSMRWGAGSLRWVRPLHSILCILSDEAGAQVVPLTVDGITAGDVTYGHRFMAPDPITVTSFDDYEAKLKRACVILRAQERADLIWAEASNQAFAAGLELVEDQGLLAEVAGLVEWPVVLMGTIADDFKGLPPEVLTTSMKEHQKFFSVRDKTGQVVRFVTVANRETADEGATILAGNQKVLFARLSDAKFFWENDLRVAKAGMGDWLDGLASVTFHAKLGSQADRVARIAALAAEIAPLVGADPEQAREAAMIAKADLRSEMVGEFPELQGVMGRYYALEAGRAAQVADACRDHWRPLGQGDAVPSAPVSVAVALADKLDTLTGFWAIDEKPTGSKDPFALRRAALGVIRLARENSARVSIEGIFRIWWERYENELNNKYNFFTLEKIEDRKAKDASRKTLINKDMYAIFPDFDGGEAYSVRCIFTPDAEKFLAENEYSITYDSDSNELLWGVSVKLPSYWIPDLLAFFHERLKVHLRDEGLRHDVIDACLAMPNNDDLTLLVNRAQALAAFLKTDNGENLIQGFKQANNLLAQAEEKDGVEYSFGADVKLADTDEEKALFAALDAADAKITPAMAAEDFASAMAAMADLREPIRAFFAAVQINADSEILRRNRLNLLHRIRTICLSVADLRKLDG